MMEFSIKGTVAGFNTAQDGRTYAKITPVLPGTINRDEKAGVWDVLVPATAIKNLAMSALVLVKGKGTVYTREAKDREGRMRDWTNFRFEADSLELAKA